MARPTKSDLLASLDAFTTAYIECALWSSTDESNDAGGEPLDSNYGPEHLTLAALREMIADCKAFLELHGLHLYGIDAAQAGHDFWLTRNGHGAGFWDRGLGEQGETLSRAAESFGSVDLTVHRGRICA